MEDYVNGDHKYDADDVANFPSVILIEQKQTSDKNHS